MIVLQSIMELIIFQMKVLAMTYILQNIYIIKYLIILYMKNLLKLVGLKTYKMPYNKCIKI